MANTRVFTGADNLTGFEKLVSDLLIGNELTLDHIEFLLSPLLKYEDEAGRER